MKHHEFIGIAAPATASALGVFGLWQIVTEIMSLPAGASGLLVQNLAAVLHPGIWYVLVALGIRQIGREAFK